jgi:hypothetical protein
VNANASGPFGIKQQGSHLILEAGDLRLGLDPACGGRISRLCWGNVELLADASVHPENWGSTFWTSPQEDWGWPPVPAVDHEPYEVSVAGDTVVLTGASGWVANKHLSVVKRFTPRRGRRIIDIEYVVRNLGAEPFSVAPWEVSRVPPGGLSFYVAGAREYTIIGPLAVLPTAKHFGVNWFDHRSFEVGRAAKVNSDSWGNWLAHVVRGQGAVPDVLFLKRFERVPLDLQAPGEGMVELYAREDGSYVEVENQGVFAPIAPGATASYGVEWRVEPVPAGIEVAAGSRSLLQWVESLLDDT